MRCPSCVPPGSRNSCSDKPPGPPCGPVFHRCPQAAEFLTPVGGGAMRPFAPAHGGGRGEAAAGMQNPTNHGATAETDGAAHPAAGPTGGPAKCGGIKGDRDARRQARAAHPRRAAHSQTRASRPTPALLWGPAGPRPPGAPRTDRRRPETARPHTHQATPQHRPPRGQRRGGASRAIRIKGPADCARLLTQTGAVCGGRRAYLFESRPPRRDNGPQGGAAAILDAAPMGGPQVRR